MAMSDHPPADTALGAGCLELLDDHRIRYYGEQERTLLRGLLDAPVPTFSRALLRAGLMRHRQGWRSAPGSRDRQPERGP